jgi:ABC-type transporter Mla subunit MlaD
MTIGFPIPSIVPIPEVATAIGNLPINPTVRNIFEEIATSGQASLFRNPVIQNINQVSSGINGIVSAISNSTCLNYTSEAKTNLTTALTGTGGLSEQVTAFTTHVNTLSGVIAGSAGNATPGLERILSVGRSIKDLVNTVDQASGCLGVLGNMTGLFSGEQLNGYASQLASFIEQINGCLADLTEILDQVNSIKAALAAIIAADQNFFNQALETLRQAALSSLLDYMYNDPCGRFILENQIGQTSLLSKLSR